MAILKKQAQKIIKPELPTPDEPALLEPEDNVTVESKALPGVLLRKPVDTLAMSPEEGGRISLIERKLYFTLMWFAQKEGWTAGQECFKAPLSQVLAKMGYRSKNMALIRDSLAAMVTTPIQWQSPTEAEGSTWGISGMISHAEICSRRIGSTVEWSYSPKIRPNILDPQLYSRGSLEVQDLLKSYSALALYDICSRYLTSPTGLTAKRHWLWWRPVLTGGSDGLDSEPQFKIFNRDVLKKAMHEINMLTQIDVQLVLHKLGPRVTEIQFRATRKKNYKPPLQGVKTVSGLKAVGRAIASGIAQQQAELFLETHGEESLTKGMDILEERNDKKNLPVVKKPKNYLAKVLDSQSFEATTGALVNIKKEDAIERQKRLQLLDQFRANKLEEAWQLFSESTTQDNADLADQFKREVISKSPKSLQLLYQQKGLQAASLKSLMRNFLAESFFGKDWNKPSDAEFHRFVILHASV